MLSELFLQAERYRRVQRRRARRRKRLPAQQEPNTIRMTYFAALRRLLERAKAMVNERVLGNLRDFIAESDFERGDSVMRIDAPGKRINALFDQLAEDFYREIPAAQLEGLATQVARTTSAFQREQLMKQIRAAIGVEVPFSERGLGPRIEAFTAENVALIKSIPQRYFDDVEKRLLADLRLGLRFEEIAKELEERFDVAESSAKLVARDQVGKFYGELNEVRQQQLGIERYVWRTVNDNRVRPEHQERDGRSYRWEDPPEDGPPGQAVNCRCYAEPDLSGILESLG